MDADDEVCLCFHVTKRKLLNYLRVERPLRATQLSECGGAGTGCGWCRTYLERLFAQNSSGDRPVSKDDRLTTAAAEPTRKEYAAQRARYIRGGGGTPPPGATPIAPEELAD